ncbi:Bug family tripartite tricarboxylate transporter substrate binding protein [Ramlibacter sp.]|uniref:Bug family tripartite tricarboxylate transporter substrate binding protein n=1 Tax=Ramlibacter sp. TaxID=1917967 RepID=UPI003D0F2460
MPLTRRQIIKAAGAAAAVIALPRLAFAQQYPNKTVRIVVGSAPGSTVDANARFMAEQLGSRMKQTFVVDNRAGAGGGIASDFVGKAAPDGYTLLFTGITHFTTRIVPDSALTYDPVAEFVGIVKVSNSALTLVVPTDSPYKSLSDLIGALRAKPGEIPYGSGGKGSTSHLAAVTMTDLTKTKARHIAYKGNAQAITDTVSGQVAYTWQGSGSVLQLMRGGRLRALAVSSDKRWEGHPEVPTGAEAGVPGLEMASWMGFIGPKGFPAAIAQQLSDESVRIARSNEYKEFALKQGMSVDIMDHRAFNADFPKENEKWKRAIALAHAE